VIQLPGVNDPERAKSLIQDTALLEFKMLDEDNQPGLGLPVQVKRSEETSIQEKFADKVPDGSEILFEPIPDSKGGPPVFSRPYLVQKEAALTGDVLQDARVNYTEFSEVYVGVTFDSKGAKEFGRITSANVGKFMAIVLDGTVYSAPRINEPILGGRAQITGNFTTDEANDLAIVLRAGALPAPMKTIQDLTVGPSLGQDSIEERAEDYADCRPDRAGLYGDLLPDVGGDCRCGPGVESPLFVGRVIRSQRDADVAGDRGHHFDDRHGGGLQYFDF